MRALLALALPLVLGCGSGSSTDAAAAGQGVRPQAGPDAKGPDATGPAATGPVALFEGAAPELLRGRVLDDATGEPGPRLWVRLEGAGPTRTTRTTDTGHFLCAQPVEDGQLTAAVALDASGPWLAVEAALEHRAAQAEARAHELRVALGPTYELDFLELAQDQPERWEARLVERDPRGNFRTWSWRVLRPGNFPRLSYLAAEQPPSEDFRAWVELRLRGQDWFARAPVGSTRGLRREPLELQLVQYAGFGGRLSDTEGRPVAGAQLSLRQESGSEAPLLYDGPRVAWSDADGLFRFEQRLEPGGYHLRVLSEGREPVQLDLELESGELEGYELRLSAGEAREQLAVALVSDGGASPPEAIVSLRSIDGAGVRRALHTQQAGTQQGFVERAGSGCAMLFAGLPAGRYEASVFGVDGRRYEPTSVELELPFDAEGLAFVTVGEAPRALSFSVRGAEGSAPLGSYSARMSGRGWWFPDFARVLAGGPVGEMAVGGGASEWMVFADGRRPAWGRLDQLRALDEERWEAVEVELAPGWGCELLLRDAGAGLPSPGLDSWQQAAFAHAAQPLAGVEVLADGERVGVSDASGTLRLALAAAPRALEFRKAGWRVLDARAAGGDGGEVVGVLGQIGAAVLWFRRVD